MKNFLHIFLPTRQLEKNISDSNETQLVKIVPNLRFLFFRILKKEFTTKFANNKIYHTFFKNVKKLVTWPTSVEDCTQ